MGEIFSDILVLLAGAKLFFELARQGIIPLALFVAGSLVTAFALGVELPIARPIIKESISAIAIFLYAAYFFYLKKYHAPDKHLFDLYTAFAGTLVGIYFVGKIVRVAWVVLIALATALFFMSFFGNG